MALHSVCYLRLKTVSLKTRNPIWRKPHDEDEQHDTVSWRITMHSCNTHARTDLHAHTHTHMHRLLSVHVSQCKQNLFTADSIFASWMSEEFETAFFPCRYYSSLWFWASAEWTGKLSSSILPLHSALLHSGWHDSCQQFNGTIHFNNGAKCIEVTNTMF